MHISWARLASFCHLGVISDPLIVSKFRKNGIQGLMIQPKLYFTGSFHLERKLIWTLFLLVNSDLHSLSSHRLEVETGRWARPNAFSFEERKYFSCNSLEYEFHFVL